MGWWHNIEVGGHCWPWPSGHTTTSLFTYQLAAGTTGRGDLGVLVPVFLSPTTHHLPVHLLAIVSVQPTLHLRECMGWWGGGGHWSVREVDWGWCQSLWQMKGWEWVVMVIRGEGVEG
jgi:hypothetical protein